MRVLLMLIGALCASAAFASEIAQVAVPERDGGLRGAYDRAAFIENNEKNRYYLNRSVVPTWIGNEDVFWYRRETAEGYRFTRVVAETGRRSELFDHVRLAAVLQSATGRSVSADALPLRGLRALPDGALTFVAYGKGYSYDAHGVLKEAGDAREVEGAVTSPDGTKIAFVRDFNLWVLDVRTRKERPLTTDGEVYYAYAMRPDASRKIAAEVQWSPDSRKLLSVQTDERQVRELPLIRFVPEEGRRASSVRQRQAQPDDEHVPMFRMLIVDADTGRQTRIRYPDIPAVRMLDTPINGGRAWWSADSRSAYFVDVSRGEKAVHVIVADAVSGETRTLFSEQRPDAYVELGSDVYGAALIEPLPVRNQLLWYSERSGWPHLYLYDLRTGELVRQLTSGEWSVRDILHVDEKRGEVLLAALGRSASGNPYYEEIVRVSLSGKGGVKTLSAGPEHRAMPRTSLIDRYAYGMKDDDTHGVSPSGKYWVETRVRLDMPARSVLRSRAGDDVAVIEEARVSGLPDGFQWPQHLMLKAADGITLIQALVARPSDFDPDKQYPVIDHVYGGPQTIFVPTSFTGAAVSAQAMAELGFIVVVIDGRGTPGRSRAFHEASYGALETASNLEDHIAAIRQLAARYPYIDLNRVGVDGFSAGGYLAVSAMLRFPDFYKVGVAASGSHDQRVFWHSWGERYQGLLAGDNYDQQANVAYVAALKGKLLLTHGMMDFGVHPSATFQLMQAFIDANKDFDLLLLPLEAHAVPGYALRRQWDYFVRNLAGLTPPDHYELQSSDDFIKQQRAVLLEGAKPHASEAAAVRVLLETPLGAITVEVYPAVAPKSAGAFLKYVDQGRYDGGSFFRVVRADNDTVQPGIEIVQARADVGSTERTPVAHEGTGQTGLSHVAGAVSLPRREHAAASAAGFFISVGANPELDQGGARNPDGQGFAVFGRVIEGMELIRKIQALPSNAPTDNPHMKGQTLDQPVLITRAVRTR
jgi:dipeptidyl-peptidase 4